MAHTALVPVFTGTLSNASVQLCNARDLHAFMAVLRDFTTWIKGRIRKFGFVEGVDFITVKNLSSPELGSAKARPQTLTDYHLTLDMAKELSMVENNPKGREARRYFIDCEKATHPAPTPYSVAPGQTLSAEQADTLRGLLTSFAESMPKDLRAQIMIQGWSKLKAHFKADYRHIPAGQFTEAVSILGRHIAHWAPADPQKTLIGLPAPAADYIPTLRGRRWVITVDWEGKEHVTPVADGAMIYTWEQVLRRVAINDELPKGFLLELANAAMSALYKANCNNPATRQQVLA